MREIVHDALFLLSLSGLTYGFWLAWSPLGAIVPSGIVLSLLIFGRLAKRDNKP